MKRALFALACVALPACGGDETLTGYGAAGSWRLTEIDGQPFAATANMTFSEGRAVSGDGPCNRFSATQMAPYPWFQLGPIAATRRACPDLPAEAAFFDALAAMTISEVLTDTLILSNEAGREMVFTRQPAG